MLRYPERTRCGARTGDSGRAHLCLGVRRLQLVLVPQRDPFDFLAHLVEREKPSAERKVDYGRLEWRSTIDKAHTVNEPLTFVLENAVRGLDAVVRRKERAFHVLL